MAPQISQRACRVPASPIRKLMPLADAARKRGIEVLQLNIGQPDLSACGWELSPPATARSTRPA